MDIEKLLYEVKDGTMSIEQAEMLLKKMPYEDIGIAKLDHHRKLRSGFGEVVFCSGKQKEHLLQIFQTFYEQGEDVLGTRASKEQYDYMKFFLPAVQYDPVSRILKIHENPVPLQGCVAVCTGGTADIPVAEEAAVTAEFFGSHVIRIYDVGVAGIHRIFKNLDQIRSANCIIAVAGMEGALPGVLGGLVEKPILAVPTSVGYGANFNGLSALLTMINSCSNGIAVVNIDNGYGAGYMATQINRLAVQNKTDG